MTSLCSPDYNISVNLEMAEFHQLSGISLDVEIEFGKNKKRINGMMIIPEGNTFPEITDTCEAWLWLDDKLFQVNPGTEIEIKIVKCCDFNISPNELNRIIQYYGDIISGTLGKNWHS